MQPGYVSGGWTRITDIMGKNDLNHETLARLFLFIYFIVIYLIKLLFFKYRLFVCICQICANPARIPLALSFYVFRLTSAYSFQHLPDTDRFISTSSCTPNLLSCLTHVCGCISDLPLILYFYTREVIRYDIFSFPKWLQPKAQTYKTRLWQRYISCDDTTLKQSWYCLSLS